MKARDLVKEALDIQEDVALSHFAEKRDNAFRKTKVLKHSEVWWNCYMNLDIILM